MRREAEGEQSRPDLFEPGEVEARYSLAMYHLQGSRILSRSFTLQKDEDDEDDAAEAGNTSMGSAMDVEADAPHAHGAEEAHGEEEEGEGSEDSDEEDAGVVAMVPLADMLNARYQSENVRLSAPRPALADRAHR